MDKEPVPEENFGYQIEQKYMDKKMTLSNGKGSCGMVFRERLCTSKRGKEQLIELVLHDFYQSDDCNYWGTNNWSIVNELRNAYEYERVPLVPIIFSCPKTSHKRAMQITFGNFAMIVLLSEIYFMR